MLWPRQPLSEPRFEEIKPCDREDPAGHGKERAGRVGGDVATGAATVILEMGAAKKAAHAIDRMLRERQASF